MSSQQAWAARLVAPVAAAWSLFQLMLAQFLLLPALHVRAIHLAFALVLVYLCCPLGAGLRRARRLAEQGGRPVPWYDLILALVAAAGALYLAWDYSGVAARQGLPLTRDVVAGLVLMALLLEACRRALGPALTVVALLFCAYAFLGPYLPMALAFKGVSLARFIGQQTMSTEGLYGIPLDVSATIVYLFVLFGALMDKAGGGEYFVRLSYSLLGSFRGGPAKAAVMASGLTGMVSGSSIANVVTTGTFTIPLMKSVGYPPKKAAAIEVGASTDGQLMPPIMGAAAFIMAEYCNLSYLEVVKAAALPALLSYLTLFFITHLEAGKLGLATTPRAQLPPFGATLRSGLHFLIPLAALIVDLIWLRRSPQMAAFHAILILVGLIIIQSLWGARRRGLGMNQGLRFGLNLIWRGLVAGGINMMAIGAAVAGAGIIVGVVTLGLGGLITEAVEAIAGNNLFLLLVLTAIACLLMGLGLPTTATYIVMASLTAKVIVDLAPGAGLEVPLIAAHLFVFYFGILADDTPPVGVAAYAAAAIARSDPIATGLQGFMYDIRTAILPFMFVLNPRLLLIGVDSWWLGMWIFFTGMLAMFAFAGATQGFLVTRNRWWEAVLLLTVTAIVLQPFTASDWLGLDEPELVKGLGAVLFGLIWLGQRRRQKGERLAVA